jgi:hypothetical protein
VKPERVILVIGAMVGVVLFVLGLGLDISILFYASAPIIVLTILYLVVLRVKKE